MTPEDQAPPPFALSWGHASGLIDLRRPERASDLEALVDRQAILETLPAYGMSIDERRWDVLEDILTEDHQYRGDVAGVAHLPEFDSRQVYVDWLKNYTDTLEPQLRHVFTNILVTGCNGDEATLVAYLTLCSVTTEGARLAATSFYDVSLRREDGTWRISRMYTGFDTAF